MGFTIIIMLLIFIAVMGLSNLLHLRYLASPDRHKELAEFLRKQEEEERRLEAYSRSLFCAECDSFLEGRGKEGYCEECYQQKIVEEVKEPDG